MIAGVDFDSFAVYIAALPFDSELDAREARFTTVTFRDRKRDTSADRAFELAVYSLPTRLRFELAPLPSVVWIERAMSEQRKHLFTMGRVQGIVATTLLELGVTVLEEVTPQQWKIGVAGKGYGNAKKAVVHDHLAELFDGELPDDENMRDALAIAWHARNENARGE